MLTTRAKERLGAVLREKWRLDELLGVGGVGAVYAATHRAGKRVAIKVMHRDLVPDDDARRRFLREAYIANEVRHPDAVSVLDDDVAEDGCLFLVMDLLEGETAHALWTRRGKVLELATVLGMVDRLLDVLASAHARKIVHRDIKPENMFLTRDGGLKVLDFGFARLLDGAPGEKNGTPMKRVTVRGIVVGTPAFMSPEHAEGAVEIDGRSDLWSVGATMFTLLSGRHVHEGSPPDQFIAAVQKRAPSLAEARPGLPRPLVAVVDRALAFERDARWKDAAEMRRALRSVRVETPRQSALPRLYDDEEDDPALEATVLERKKPADPSQRPPVASTAAPDSRSTGSSPARERSNSSKSQTTAALGYVVSGVTFFDKGDIQHALRDFAAALEIDPRCADAFYHRGILRQSLGHLVLATNDFASAIRVDPLYAAAWYNRAVAELALEQFASARRYACRAFALYRDRGDADAAERARRLVTTIDQRSA